jgi:hypothetical protein
METSVDQNIEQQSSLSKDDVRDCLDKVIEANNTIGE